MNQLHAGELRIGTATNILVTFLGRVLERFQTEYPKVEMHLRIETAEHLIQEIPNVALDVAVIFLPSGLEKGEKGLVYDPLYTEEFLFLVGRRHLLAKRVIVPLSRLVEYLFIMFMQTSYVRKLLEDRLAKAGLVPKVGMELENEEAMQGMLNAVNCVAVVSKRGATSDHIRCLRTKEEPL